MSKELSTEVAVRLKLAITCATQHFGQPSNWLVKLYRKGIDIFNTLAQVIIVYHCGSRGHVQPFPYLSYTVTQYAGVKKC